MRCTPLACLFACLCSCASTPEPETPLRPDAEALAIKTSVLAESVVIVLSSRWSDHVKLEADRREQPRGGVIVGVGHATLTLEALSVTADRIELRFLTDPAHEDILLHARRVARFQQHVEYGHRVEHADAVTMANTHVNVFQQ